MVDEKYWLHILPLLFLLATFEHCYETFSLHSGGLNFPMITTILLVLAIDSSIYFSMQYIELWLARIILGLSASISVALNVKYRLDWKPDGTFGLVIAIVSGVLIPGMLSLFGWLKKEVSKEVTNGTPQLHDAIIFYTARFPEKSDREVAGIFGCSHTTVRRYRSKV